MSLTVRLFSPPQCILRAAFAFIFRCPPLPPGISSLQSRHRRNRTGTIRTKPAPSPCRRVDETADLPKHPIADRIHFHQQFMPSLRQGDEAAVVESATELLLLPIPHHPILSPLQQQHRRPSVVDPTRISSRVAVRAWSTHANVGASITRSRRPRARCRS